MIQHLQLASPNGASQFGIHRLSLLDQQEHQKTHADAQRQAGWQQPPPDRRHVHAGTRRYKYKLVFRIVGGHAVNQACVRDLQRIGTFRGPGFGRWPGLRHTQYRNRPRAVVEYHQQAASGRQVDHIGQMPAGGRDAKITAPEHQRGTVFIRLGGGVQPIAIGGALDIRRP
ncbi:hypothetical protein D3C85_1205080 [compost metagenome]